MGNGVAFMLTQEESGEEQGGEARRGETDEGSSKDDDSTSGYESPEDPHCRRKLVGSLPWGIPTVVVYR